MGIQHIGTIYRYLLEEHFITHHCMFDTNHCSSDRVDTAISDDIPERLCVLGARVLDLLEGEFAGVIRSHSRGEVYGGC